MVGAVGIVGCTDEHRTRSTSPSTGTAIGQSAVRWRSAAVPPQAVRLTRVTQAGEQLVLSGQRGSGDAAPPGLWRRDGHGAWHDIPLRAATYYGRRAELFRVVSDGEQVVALGRRIGGAHGNPRVTSWTGTLAEVRETEQPFELFGGPDAIAVTDLAIDRQGGIALGAWAPHGEASGVTVWRQRGSGWQRLDRAPGLASQVTVVGSDLTTPGAVAVRGNEPVLVGWSAHLAGGEAQLRATLWNQAAGTWRAVRLPAAGDSQARAVTCGVQSCTVVGSASGRLAVWTVRGDQVSAVRVPALEVDDREPVQAVTVGASTWISVGQSDHSRVLRLAAGFAQELTSPVGVVTSMAVVGSDVVVLSRDASGRTALWTTSA